jgi:hypothetical protein
VVDRAAAPSAILVSADTADLSAAHYRFEIVN